METLVLNDLTTLNFRLRQDLTLFASNHRGEVMADCKGTNQMSIDPVQSAKTIKRAQTQTLLVDIYTTFI